MDILGPIYYWNLQRAMRRERIFRDRINPLDKYDDVDFKYRYRFSRDVVLDLIDEFKDDIEGAFFRNTDISPTFQILLALRFFATGSFQRTAGDLHGVSIATAHRIIHRVARVIAMRKNRYVNFPSREEYEQVKADFFAIAGFPNVIGAIDCTHIKITKPRQDDAVRFINRKGVYSINVQLVVDAKYRITSIVARWPGGTHDSRILENSNLINTLQGLAGSYVLGDAGYALAHYIMTPLRNPNTNQETHYNVVHSRTRIVVERAIGIWKRRFPVLQDPIRTHLDNTFVIIVAAAVLHNIALARDRALPDDAQEVDNNDDNNVGNNDDNEDVPPPLGNARGNARGNAIRRNLIENVLW